MTILCRAIRVGLAALAFGAVQADAARAQSPRAAWNSGTPGEPVLTVRRLAPQFWVIRQSKLSNAEAPFIYLVAGKTRALLLDTGAEPASGTRLPLRELVDSLLRTVAARPRDASLPLVVAHSHAHRDHRFLDSAFATRPATTVVEASVGAIQQAFGIARWPDGEGSLDLGGRRLTVLPTPGHEPLHLMFHDAATGTLLSGDMLYPGLLTVRDPVAFAASAQRLAAYARTHHIAAILGAHVEMTATPRLMYPLGTVRQSHEHPLALTPRAIAELATATASLDDFLADDVHAEFIIGRVSAPSTDPPSTHGMLLVGRERLWLSHLPMFRTPHNYQLIFEGALPDETLALYRADAAAHPDAMYTVEPTGRWVLPTTVKPGATFEARLYRGHFERGGVMLVARATITVRQLVTFRRFTPGRVRDANAWIAFGDRTERYLAHRIEGPPDVDQLVQLCAGSARAVGRDISLAVRDTLSAGDGTRAGRVCRVIYTERSDLAH